MELITQSNVNSLGLVLDIAGVCLLFKYGLPERLDREGRSYLMLQTHDDAEIRTARFYDRMSYLALVLIVAGFGLQIVSNYL